MSGWVMFSLPVFQLPWWGYVLVTLALTQVTIAAVTIFLHRSQAHRKYVLIGQKVSAILILCTRSLPTDLM